MIVPLLFCLLAAGPLSYEGFSLATGVAALIDKYPGSAHEFWPKPSGEIVRSQDNAGRLRQLVKEGSGAYLVRLSAKEAHDHIYLLHADLENGSLERLRISLEMPAHLLTARVRNGLEAFEKRHPPCSQVLDALTGKLGQPAPVETRTEEGLDHQLHSWTRNGEKLSLDCGQYVGRKVTFALDVTLSKATGH
ncbi:MAG: hypothetical protein HY013_02775 [Candidatus Solibacter usitatus]|nr:hypothetical protein [Candidatus Solibacter usitatus]